MSDRLTLSCWLQSFHTLTLPVHWDALLRSFPYSKLDPAEFVTAKVHAISLAEPLILERRIAAPFDAAEVSQIAREFQHADCAYELECAWDLMEPENGDWKLSPVEVSLWCFGPEFENELGDHVRIEFGMEYLFLPVEGDASSVRPAEANLRSMARLIKDISDRLPVERKYLWSEGGTDFAEKLARFQVRGMRAQ
ncbi:MAG: hypothetical protein HYZ37_09540 [Candidatus Solibacter usitatus]|nr:hypothetical protein [Candidatus Solibacter usitatus]